ncbi:hypothetical protein A20C1_05352 [marine actinobacterium PHSC20C1]|nr:hypothetical protein A20C1_05352 [marine actinobacterium PHSC20C1]
MISLKELLTTAQVGVNITFRYAEYYTVAIMYYLVIVTIITLVQSRIEKRFLWTSRGVKKNTDPISLSTRALATVSKEK